MVSDTTNSSGLDLSGVIKSATDIVNAGATIYNKVAGTPTPSSGSPASAVAASTGAASTASALSKYLPYILGGVGLLVVGFLVFRKK